MFDYARLIVIYIDKITILVTFEISRVMVVNFMFNSIRSILISTSLVQICMLYASHMLCIHAEGSRIIFHIHVLFALVHIIVILIAAWILFQIPRISAVTKQHLY